MFNLTFWILGILSIFLSLIGTNFSITTNSYQAYQFIETYDKNYLIHRSSHNVSNNRFHIVMGYVTPWNKHGYTLSKEHQTKFTIICPTWFEASYSYMNGIKLNGVENIDMEWLRTVDSRKIFPRIVFPFETFANIFAEVHKNKDEQLLTILLLQLMKKLQIAIEVKFQGIVFESSYLNSLLSKSKENALELIIFLGKLLNSINLKVVVVIPPNFPQNLVFNSKDYERIYPYIHGLYIMTYDYSLYSGEVSQNFPHNWIKYNINNICFNSTNSCNKLVVGLPNYGYIYQQLNDNLLPTAIKGNDFIKILQSRNVNIFWDEINKEHYFSYNYPNSIFFNYPTIESLILRLNLASDKNCSIGFWELGQAQSILPFIL